MGARIWIVIALVCAISSTVEAQSPEAEAVFREGKKLIKEGKIAEGCAKLEASERIESSTGTLLNLGDCREQNHQLASAWAAFIKAATSAKAASDRKRETEARKRAKSLEAKLGKLRIDVKAKVEGLSITRGDQTIDSALWGTEIPIDAGELSIEASAPGYERWTGNVTTRDGTIAQIEVPALVKAKVVEKSPPTKDDVVVDKQISDSPIAPETNPGTFTPMRTVAVGLAVAGLAGISLGIKFGLDSKSEESDANAICPVAACTDQRAVDLNDDAKRHATYANVGFIAGGAAVAGAVVLWFVGAPKRLEAVSVTPTAHGAAFAIGGRF